MRRFAGRTTTGQTGWNTGHMRSSKSRSRNKSNRNNRSVGNIVNRVFDSSGPEGKVRGTPQQIIDKYNQLARDAQLANDRVATENFQQHAEHYLRMLAEAQREQDQKREQQEQENRQRQSDRDRERSSNNQRQDNGGSDEQPHVEQPKVEQPVAEQVTEPAPKPVRQRQETRTESDALGVMETSADGEDSGLVETPENKAPKRAPRPRKPRAKKSDAGDPAPDEGTQTAAE